VPGPTRQRASVAGDQGGAVPAHDDAPGGPEFVDEVRADATAVVGQLAPRGGAGVVPPHRHSA
jgi:hypothetical protein